MLSDNDIKEELSYVYAHALATHVGYSIEHVRKDRDSIDMRICAKGFLDPNSFLMSPSLELQLKATSQEITGNEIPFPLSVKNYSDLSGHTMVPRILVVLLLPASSKEFVICRPEHLVVHGQAYWLSLAGFEASNNSSTKTVKIPKKNVFNDITLRELMIAASKRERLTNAV